jgi:hypothetical protein
MLLNRLYFLIFMSVSAAAQTTGSLSVPLPCGAPGTGLRACSVVLNGGAFTNGSTTTAEVNAQKVPGILTMLQQQIQKQIDCQAQGVDLSSTLATPAQLATPSASCVGPSFGPYACDPVANSFNKGAEGLVLGPYGMKNHEGQSCGIPATVTVTDTILYGPFGIPTGVNVNANISGSVTTSQEYAYANGALMQAEACYYAQVVQEINSGAVHSNPIPLPSPSPGGVAPDPCAALANNLIAVSSSYNAQLSAALKQLTGDQRVPGLQASLETQANITDIMSCQNNFQTTAGPTQYHTYQDFNGKTVTAQSIDDGALRQSSQQLCTTRASLESAYTQFAACEVLARAQGAWSNLFGSPALVQNNLINPLIDPSNPNSVNSICTKQCRSGQSAPSPTPSTASQAAAVEAQANAALGVANTCAQTCYNNNVGPFVQNLIQSYFPNSGACAQ